ncbi:MAG TPA: PsbP-related protein [Patescibacteria group bacterium]|nr:PsbP-related protein [Patescibacteria group bacterium]
MKKILISCIIFLSISFFVGCGQRQVNQDTGQQPPSATQATPKEEMENWKTYSNKKYGFELKFPVDWIFDENDNDIHLSNMNPSDGPSCDNQYSGLEIMVNNEKDPNVSFTDFVKSQVADTEGLNPSGKIEELSVPNNKSFMVERSGWDSGCAGPGYFIEQSPGKYVYIFTGNANDSEDVGVIAEIISTFKFTK